MDVKKLAKLRSELAAYLDGLLPDRLGNLRRRRWAEVYLRGLADRGEKAARPGATRH